MEKIELHKDVFLIKDFLTKNQCDFFIEKGEEISFQEAKVNIDGTQVVLKGVRNNKRIMFKDKELAYEIWEKLKSFSPSKKGYEAMGPNELFRIYKYNKEERFKMHRDGSFKRNETESSLYSLLIYLNENFEGGETYFEKGINIKPKTGDVLIFRHPLRHEGKKITSGTKYVLRTDIMFKNLKK